ncbi:hypothetical protein DL96DRAFT_1627378, partial [Flagelloscypha sp. PMI_526]
MMDSRQPNPPPAPFSIDLPREILLNILEEYLIIPPPTPVHSVLILSKLSYNWFLPQLYHTLSVSASQLSCPGRPSYDELLSCARPCSLALVKCLDCSFIDDGLTFQPFSSLTHLVVWDSVNSKWWNDQSAAVAMLSLEELLIWDKSDLDILASKLSAGAPLCRTISKLGFYNAFITNPHHNWPQYFRPHHKLPGSPDSYTSTFSHLAVFLY